MGIAREHSTGDEKFDATVYVRCPVEDYAQSYLTDESRRVAVTSILESGFKEVELDGTHAWAAWPGFNPKTDDRSGLITETASSLFRLAESLPESVEIPQRDVDRGKRIQKRLLVLESLFAALVLFRVRYPALRHGEPFLPVLLLSLVTLLPFGWVAAYLLRGESHSHDQWRAVMLCSLVAIPLGCVGMILGVNGLTDWSPLETRVESIVGKRVASKRHGKSYHVNVTDSGRRQGHLDLRVSRAQYEDVVPGKSRMELTVGRGGLGIEWRKAHKLLP